MSRQTIRRKHAKDIAALRALWSLDSGDAWGETTSHHFAICEELYRRGCTIPDDWQFRPSPMLKRGRYVETSTDGGTWPDSEIAALKASPAALRYFGDMLARLARYLKHKSLDY